MYTHRLAGLKISPIKGRAVLRVLCLKIHFRQYGRCYCQDDVDCYIGERSNVPPWWEVQFGISRREDLLSRWQKHWKCLCARKTGMYSMLSWGKFSVGWRKWRRPEKSICVVWIVHSQLMDAGWSWVFGSIMLLELLLKIVEYLTRVRILRNLVTLTTNL